ncbi:MAG: M1 family metallopeptidase [Firmicutes bacterium]|nr:M1 family metallopeptidase [Bacillota bacterium]
MKKLILITAILILMCCVLTACAKNSGDGAVELPKNLNEYEILISISDDLRTLDLKQTITYTNTESKDLNSLVFYLYANAFREGAEHTAYLSRPAGYGGIDMLSVTVNGEKVTYSIKNTTIMTLSLNAPIAVGEKALIRFEAKINVPVCNLRMGLSANILNMGSFYPVLSVFENGSFREDIYSRTGDPFYQEIANYKVIIECNPALVIASSGSQSSETFGRSYKRVEINAEGIRDFAFVASYTFNVLSGEVNGTDIFYYYPSSDKPPVSAFETAKNTLKVFNEIIGDYPYPSFSLADINFYYGGMEYSGLVFINRTATDKEAIVIHETLHQWFGMVVGSDHVNSAWLDEALVTFLSDYYYLKSGNSARFKTLRGRAKNEYDSYVRLQKPINPETSLNFTQSIYAFSTAYEYSMAVYTRGSLFFDNVFSYAGEKSFDKALRYYYEQNAFKFATKESLLTAFRVKRKDIGFMLDAWISDSVVTFKQN